MYDMPLNVQHLSHHHLESKRSMKKRRRILTTADEVTTGKQEPLCPTFDLRETSIAERQENGRRHGST